MRTRPLRFHPILLQSWLLCIILCTCSACSSTSALLDQAIQADDQRDFARAITLYTKVIEADSGSYDGWNNRGYIYLRRGRFDSAVADFSQAIALAPTRQTALYNRATAYRVLQQYDSAVADYTQLMEMAPLDMSIQMLRARTYNEAKEFVRATEDYDVVLSFDQYYYQAYGERGATFMNRKEPAKALEDCNEAISIARALLQDLLSQGFNRYWNPQWQPGTPESTKRNNIARAAQQYRRILSSMFVNRATVYTDSGLYDLALEDCHTAIGLDSSNASAYGNMGWVYYLKNDFQACIDFSEQAIRSNGVALYARYNRAIAFLRLGRSEQATAAYRETQEYTNFLLDADNYTDSTPGTAQIADVTILVKEAREGAMEDLRDLVQQKIQAEEAKRILHDVFFTEIEVQ